MFAQLAYSHHLVADCALVFWFVSDSCHLQNCPLSSFSSDTYIKFVTECCREHLVSILLQEPRYQRVNQQLYSNIQSATIN